MRAASTMASWALARTSSIFSLSARGGCRRRQAERASNASATFFCAPLNDDRSACCSRASIFAPDSPSTPSTSDVAASATACGSANSTDTPACSDTPTDDARAFLSATRMFVASALENTTMNSSESETRRRHRRAGLHLQRDRLLALEDPAQRGHRALTTSDHDTVTVASTLPANCIDRASPAPSACIDASDMANRGEAARSLRMASRIGL